MTFDPEPDSLIETPTKRSWKHTAIYTILIAGAVGILSCYLLFIINQWFNEHTFRFTSPVEFHVPITVEKRLSTLPIRYESKGEIHNAAVPTTSDNTSAKTLSIPTIVKTVYQLESSSGKQDPCTKKGKYNGYGYIPGNCYGSHAQVTALVTKWFEKNTATYGIAKSICGYNLGFKSIFLDDCIKQSSSYPYYKNFLTLIN